VAGVVTDVLMDDLTSPERVTDGVAAVAAVTSDVFMVVVKSPLIGALDAILVVATVATFRIVILFGVVADVACLMLVRSRPTWPVVAAIPSTLKFAWKATPVIPARLPYILATTCKVLQDSQRDAGLFANHNFSPQPFDQSALLPAT